MRKGDRKVRPRGHWPQTDKCHCERVLICSNYLLCKLGGKKEPNNPNKTINNKRRHAKYFLCSQKTLGAGHLDAQSWCSLSALGDVWAAAARRRAGGCHRPQSGIRAACGLRLSSSACACGAQSRVMASPQSEHPRKGARRTLCPSCGPASKDALRRSCYAARRSPPSPSQIQREETWNSLLQGRTVKGFEDIF